MITKKLFHHKITLRFVAKKTSTTRVKNSLHGSLTSLNDEIGTQKASGSDLSTVKKDSKNPQKEQIL